MANVPLEDIFKGTPYESLLDVVPNIGGKDFATLVKADHQGGGLAVDNVLASDITAALNADTDHTFMTFLHTTEGRAWAAASVGTYDVSTKIGDLHVDIILNAATGVFDLNTSLTSADGHVLTTFLHDIGAVSTHTGLTTESVRIDGTVFSSMRYFDQTTTS